MPSVLNFYAQASVKEIKLINMDRSLQYLSFSWQVASASHNFGTIFACPGRAMEESFTGYHVFLLTRRQRVIEVYQRVATSVILRDKLAPWAAALWMADPGTALLA
ncbi:hypothetical protein ACJJTC_012267 [Scirpophaga incertulas]